MTNPGKRAGPAAQRRLAWQIAWRYLFSRKANRFISFVSLFSVIGITLGVAVIIVVLSVMNGFRSEIQNKILNFTSHGQITRFDGGLEDWRGLPADVLRDAGVVRYAPMVETQAMLSHGGRARGVYVRGVSPELEAGVVDIASYVTQGSLASLRDGEYNIVLGDSLARYLGLALGDKLSLLGHRGGVTPLGVIPRIRRFTVSGIFDIGLSQYDGNVALVHLADARALKSYKREVDSVHFSVADVFEAPHVAARLSARLGDDYFVSDWTQRHRNFFRALEMEKLILGVLLTLIVAVAVFNVVSTLVMLVMEKRGDIAVLKTLGLQPSAVLNIFIAHGCMLGCAGVFFGAVVGALLTHFLRPLAKAIESLSGRPLLSGDVYPITEVPAELQAGDLALVLATAFVLVLLATVYPARYAARLAPAQMLKDG